MQFVVLASSAATSTTKRMTVMHFVVLAAAGRKGAPHSPRFAVQRGGTTNWRATALSERFHRHCNEQMPLGLRARPAREQPVPLEGRLMALGVHQDVEELPRAFGVGYTFGPPMAGDGHTDARYAKAAPVAPPGRSGAQPAGTLRRATRRPRRLRPPAAGGRLARRAGKQVT